MNRKTLYKVIGCIFILLLILPCFGILREKRNIELIAEMENRSINSKPVAKILTGKFFKEFESWYDDRLLGRKDLIRLWSSINGKLFNVLISKEVALGKDGYLFFPFNLSQELVDTKEKMDLLIKINDLCKKDNIRFTIFITPPSEWILPELLPEKYKPANIEVIEAETGKMLREVNIDYCFIANKMLEESLKERQSMYYAGDNHWNKKGGYYGARELLKHLGFDKKINSDVFYNQEIGFGDIYTKKIGWETIKSIVDVPWSNNFDNDIKEESHIAGEVINGAVSGAAQKGELIYVNNNASNKIKVLILGDSFYYAMSRYLLQDISTIILSHNCDMATPKNVIDVSKMIEKYQPDVVVYEKVGCNFYGHGYDAVFDNYKI